MKQEDRITKEQFLKKVLLMGFKLEQKRDEKCDIYILDDLKLFIYEYVYKSSWYNGVDDKGIPIKHTRESIRRVYTWSDKRHSSSAFTWDDIQKLEKKIEDVKSKPINDESLQSGQLLSDEAQSMLYRKEATDSSNIANA